MCCLGVRTSESLHFFVKVSHTLIFKLFKFSSLHNIKFFRRIKVFNLFMTQFFMAGLMSLISPLLHQEIGISASSLQGVSIVSHWKIAKLHSLQELLL